MRNKKTWWAWPIGWAYALNMYVCELLNVEHLLVDLCDHHVLHLVVRAATARVYGSRVGKKRAASLFFPFLLAIKRGNHATRRARACSMSFPPIDPDPRFFCFSRSSKLFLRLLGKAGEKGAASVSQSVRKISSRLKKRKLLELY